MSRDAEPPGHDGNCPTCGARLPDPGSLCPACAETRSPSRVAAEPDADRTRTLSAPPEDLEPFTGPKRVAHYRVLREIGSGGMGTVFEAYDEKMHRKVALKVLSRHHAPSDKASARFAHEAWIAGKLDHPNLVKVYDRGTWEELDYYSMELVEGGSLAEVIGNFKRWGRDEALGLEFASRETVHWSIAQVIAVARGLDYAHQRQVVHRDIKPMNLLWSHELETVKIADFGLALEDDSTRLTSAGKILGTLSYMAPEQLRGEASAFDARTDVYALGVTLFELLTLELPYFGKTRQLYVNAVLTTESRRPSKLNEKVSRDLEVVTRKALEKDPADRYPSAGLLADDLENVLRLRPIRARPPSRPKRLWKWVRRKPVHAALLAALLVGLPTLSLLGHRAVQHRALVRQSQIEDLWAEVKWAERDGDDRRMIELASRVLDSDSSDVRALRSRALSYTRLRRSEAEAKAVEELEIKALADVARLIRLLPKVAWPLRVRAHVLREFGREDEALEAESLARRYSPERPTTDDLHFEGRLAMDTGNYSRAVELFSDKIVRAPNSSAAIGLRASAYEKLGRVNQAIEDYRVASALAPTEPYYYYRLGHLRTREGALEEGSSYLRRALALDPASAAVLNGLAHNALEVGRRALYDGDSARALATFEWAEARARAALEIDAGLPFAHVNLGASLMEQNRLSASPQSERMAEAMRHYEEALAIWESTGRTEEGLYGITMLNLCDGWIQLGNPERAFQVCASAVETMPGNPATYYNLAGAYALLGRIDEAFEALESNYRLGDRDWLYLSKDGWFESLRDDPRFADLIERMKENAPS